MTNSRVAHPLPLAGHICTAALAPALDCTMSACGDALRDSFRRTLRSAGERTFRRRSCGNRRLPEPTPMSAPEHGSRHRLALQVDLARGSRKNPAMIQCRVLPQPEGPSASRIRLFHVEIDAGDRPVDA